MAKHICTIIAKNYLSLARTLCESFIEYHPEGKCFVLIIDDIEGYVHPDREPFEIVTIDKIAIPELGEFCFKYNITELSTATKPYLMKYLLDTKGMESLLYLDPDILVTKSLDDLFSSLKTSDILLTPHLDKDYPDDGKLPDDSVIMQSGIFNLGFIGVRNCSSCSEFLLWWGKKLYDKCLIDRMAGFFVDQKFMDYAFVLFQNIQIVKHPGYNVAYWNIHSRTIEECENGWTCNGGPLFFYHFSNYRAEKPDDLSGFQNRYTLSAFPALAKLFATYRALLEVNGYTTTKDFPYSYARFNTGMPVHSIVRSFYRRQILRTANPADPFNFKGYTFSSKLLIYFLTIYKYSAKWLRTLLKARW